VKLSVRLIACARKSLVKADPYGERESVSLCCGETSHNSSSFFVPFSLSTLLDALVINLPPVVEAPALLPLASRRSPVFRRALCRRLALISVNY